MILLELIQVIKRKSRHIEQGKIIIALDYQEVYQGILKKIMKTNSIVSDGGGKIAAIRDTVSKVSIVIEF